MTANLLKPCDIVVRKHLKEHNYPLHIKIISNHWVRSSYEREIRAVFKKICLSHSLKSFYDIGANVGIFSLDFLSFNETNHVHAFEPNPAVFLCLKKTKEYNQIELLHVFDYALSDRSGIAQLTFDPLSPAKGGLHPIRHGKYNHELEYDGISATVDVKIDTLDSIILKCEIPPDIIKIDAEGEELSILKGAKTICERYQPILFFECSKNKEEIHSLLLSYGYAFKNINLEETDVLGDFNLAFPKNSLHYHD